jgi:hypothetical protein
MTSRNAAYCCRMPSKSEIELFRGRLRRSLLAVHTNPATIVHDEELGDIVFGLYDPGEPDRVWFEVIAPYLRTQRRGLRNVWREHAADPSFLLLDHPESLLVLERAEHDRERLRLCWPGPAAWLARISDIWGVPL